MKLLPQPPPPLVGRRCPVLFSGKIYRLMILQVAYKVRLLLTKSNILTLIMQEKVYYIKENNNNKNKNNNNNYNTTVMQVCNHT